MCEELTLEERTKRIEQLLQSAKAYPTKGRLYVYERFKQDLLDLNPTNQEYEQTCAKLSRLLKV